MYKTLVNKVMKVATTHEIIIIKKCSRNKILLLIILVSNTLMESIGKMNIVHISIEV